MSVPAIPDGGMQWTWGRLEGWRAGSRPVAEAGTQVEVACRSQALAVGLHKQLDGLLEEQLHPEKLSGLPGQAGTRHPPMWVCMSVKQGSAMPC